MAGIYIAFMGRFESVSTLVSVSGGAVRLDAPCRVLWVRHVSALLCACGFKIVLVEPTGLHKRAAICSGTGSIFAARFSRLACTGKYGSRRYCLYLLPTVRRLCPTIDQKRHRAVRSKLQLALLPACLATVISGGDARGR